MPRQRNYFFPLNSHDEPVNLDLSYPWTASANLNARISQVFTELSIRSRTEDWANQWAACTLYANYSVHMAKYLNAIVDACRRVGGVKLLIQSFAESDKTRVICSLFDNPGTRPEGAFPMLSIIQGYLCVELGHVSVNGCLISLALFDGSKLLVTQQMKVDSDNRLRWA